MVPQLRACTTFVEELFGFQKPHLVDHNHPQRMHKIFKYIVFK